MKKLILVICAIMFTITLAACADRKVEDNTINVYFFSSNTGTINEIGNYYDVEPGALLTPPEDPIRPGFDFLGWHQDLQTTIPWDFETDVMPDHTIILYAKWDILPRNIIYDLNGGEFVSSNYPQVFLPGQGIVLPQPKKTGYLFKAWYTYDQNSGDYPNTEGTKPGDPGINSVPTSQHEDIYVYAHWAVIKVTVVFRHNHPNTTTSGLTNPRSATYAYGTEVIYGETFPTFDNTQGYTFIGWNTRADGAGTWIEDGSIWTRTQQVTLYAQWQPI